ncbi:MAG: YoaK family protein [Eubacteriales bacterium]|nr:YoaK family protein [Eubacteriales bacterium]
MELMSAVISGNERWEKLLHYNMTCMGGFMGTYAVCGFEGNFASAQTGNLMSMTKALVGGDIREMLLRIGALVVFSISMAVSHILSHSIARKSMRRLCLWVDLAGLLAAAAAPAVWHSVLRLYPIFIAASFQWGTYSGAGGYSSASIFSTNNLKQAVISWTDYIVYHEESARSRASFYTLTVLSFVTGALGGCASVAAWGNRAALCGLVLLLTAWVMTAREEGR